MPLTVGAVAEILVYPVKACQAVSLDAIDLTSSGFRLDRAFCIIDLHGTRHIAREALSQRKLPKLATLTVAVDAEAGVLTLGAPDGRAPLVVPLEEEGYEGNDTLVVECSGASTTASGGWSLGQMVGKDAGEHATEWLTEYLNTVAPSNLAKRDRATYVLVRSVAGDVRTMADWAGPAQKSDSYVSGRGGWEAAWQRDSVWQRGAHAGRGARRSFWCLWVHCV
jgi:hypothetical protein